MNYIEKIKNKARKDLRTIILPETEDVRVLQAAEKIIKEGFAKVVLIGNEEETLNLAKENNINIEGTKIIEPSKSEKYEEYANMFYELRKKKGITLESVKRIIDGSKSFKDAKMTLESLPNVNPNKGLWTGESSTDKSVKVQDKSLSSFAESMITRMEDRRNRTYTA